MSVFGRVVYSVNTVIRGFDQVRMFMRDCCRTLSDAVTPSNLVCTQAFGKRLWCAECSCEGDELTTACFGIGCSCFYGNAPVFVSFGANTPEKTYSGGQLLKENILIYLCNACRS